VRPGPGRETERDDAHEDEEGARNGVTEAIHGGHSVVGMACLAIPRAGWYLWIQRTLARKTSECSMGQWWRGDPRVDRAKLSFVPAPRPCA